MQWLATSLKGHDKCFRPPLINVIMTFGGGRHFTVNISRAVKRTFTRGKTRPVHAARTNHMRSFQGMTVFSPMLQPTSRSMKNVLTHAS